MKIHLGPGLAALTAIFCLALKPFPSANADEVYTFVVKKQEEKKNTRWSLQDWIETRDKMRLMDLWLALHTPAPYEFYLGGDYRFNDTVGTRTSNMDLHAAAYATAFGLSADWTPSDKRWTALFNLRVFGFHVQGTHIILKAGIRSEGNADVRGASAGADFNLYLARFFGLSGSYLRDFESTPGPQGATSGHTFEAGPFIDFSFVRIQGSWFRRTSQLGASPEAVSTGGTLGARLFF